MRRENHKENIYHSYIYSNIEQNFVSISDENTLHPYEAARNKTETYYQGLETLDGMFGLVLSCKNRIRLINILNLTPRFGITVCTQRIHEFYEKLPRF